MHLSISRKSPYTSQIFYHSHTFALAAVLELGHAVDRGSERTGTDKSASVDKSSLSAGGGGGGGSAGTPGRYVSSLICATSSYM